MNRIESLRTIREVLEQVPADAFRAGRLFDSFGNPCCAMGHALDRISGARDRFLQSEAEHPIDRIAEALEITVEDVRDLVGENDAADPFQRKACVLATCQWLEGE